MSELMTRSRAQGVWYVRKFTDLLRIFGIFSFARSWCVLLGIDHACRFWSGSQLPAAVVSAGSPPRSSGEIMGQRGSGIL